MLLALRRWIIWLLFYPSLWWNRLLRRLGYRRWWDWVDEHVLIGAIPYAFEIGLLKGLGISAIVNMCEEFPGEAEALAAAGIEQLWLPTLDFTSPTVEDIRRGVEFIEHKAAAGGKVYVHCKAGRGRSATVVLAYLISTHRMTPDQAQRHLESVRPHVVRGISRRPAIRQFASMLAEKAAEQVEETTTKEARTRLESGANAPAQCPPDVTGQY